MVRPLLIAALVLALLLSGCTASNGPDGQSASSPGRLAYNGASTGTHESKRSCDGAASITWNGNLGAGKATVTVLDGAGASKYSKTFSSPGQSSETKSLSGADGKWTVRVERTASSSYGVSGWNGQYAVALEC